MTNVIFRPKKIKTKKKQTETKRFDPENVLRKPYLAFFLCCDAIFVKSKVSKKKSMLATV